MCVVCCDRPTSGIHVSLFRARGLQVKNAASKAKGWLLASTIPKIYVNVRRRVGDEYCNEMRYDETCVM